MAEEFQPGTAPVAEPATKAAPAIPQTPPETKPTQDVPVGTDTNLESLRAEIAERDAQIAAVTERASRAEHESMLTRNLVEQFARTQGRPQEAAPAEPAITDDEYLSHPAMATSKIVRSQLDTYFARDKAEREREKTEQYVNTARTAYEQGKAEALKANPNLYRGIETDLSREVLNTVQASLKSGAPVDASALRNPKYWEAAAVAMRIMQGDDVSKYYVRSNQPMTPAHQEVPGPGVVPKAEMTLSPEQEELISRGNITREQFMEAWKKERGIADGRRR
jgi:hypothetical protein